VRGGRSLTACQDGALPVAETWATCWSVFERSKDREVTEYSPLTSSTSLRPLFILSRRKPRLRRSPIRRKGRSVFARGLSGRSDSSKKVSGIPLFYTRSRKRWCKARIRSSGPILLRQAFSAGKFPDQEERPTVLASYFGSWMLRPALIQSFWEAGRRRCALQVGSWI